MNTSYNKSLLMSKIIRRLFALKPKFPMTNTSKGFIAKRFTKKTIWSCGIIGYVGNEPARDYLLEGLQILRNRGYDSAGISTVSEEIHKVNGVPKNHIERQNHSKLKKSSNIIKTTKFASLNTSDSLDILKKKTIGFHLSSCGIGHTRWATHGAKTDENAHPHTDQNNNVSIVHNGTIENWHELKTMLKEKGYQFRSETDTEVILNLIMFHYKKNQRKNIISALSETISCLEGTYGLAVICSDFPEQILAVRKGSPLVIGIAENKKWVASEYAAFSRHTKRYVTLKDDEIAVIKKNDISIDFEGRLKTAPPEEILLSPEPYDYWTIKEIHEQTKTINNAMNNGGRISDDEIILGGLDCKKDFLRKVKHLVICACGTSYYAALYASKIMRQLKCFESVQIVNASEFDLTFFTDAKVSALLVVSQSGETLDIVRAVQLSLDNNLFVFSVVNMVSSLIARLSICGVYLNSGREFGVASTKCFTSQTIVLILIAIWFHKLKGICDDCPRVGTLFKNLQKMSLCVGSALKIEDRCKEIAEMVYKEDHIFVLGKGYSESIAKEGALKIKEISYIHAEGFSGGELKHGPLALIRKGTPVFVILLDDKHSRRMQIAAEEVAARGAELYVITDKMDLVEGFKSEVMTIPSNGYLTPLVSIVPLQMIAFYVSLKKGINPDKPRNLAKAVTVD